MATVHRIAKSGHNGHVMAGRGSGKRLEVKRWLLLVTPWTVSRQTPLSMGFPRQKYWSRLPFPSPGDHPKPGIEPVSPALAGGFFTIEPSRKPKGMII